MAVSPVWTERQREALCTLLLAHGIDPETVLQDSLTDVGYTELVRGEGAHHRFRPWPEGFSISGLKNILRYGTALVPRVIGLGGLKESGKDAAADHLVAEHGFVKIGMSDPLLEHALIVDPYVPINTYATGTYGDGKIASGTFVRLSRLVAEVGYVEAKRNPEVRRFLQANGTEGGRDFHHENIWTNPVGDRISAAILDGRGVVVTGVRFPNELRMVHQFGGRTAWIERPSVRKGEDSHESENALTAYDFNTVILNNGTLEDLYEQVDRVAA